MYGNQFWWAVFLVSEILPLFRLPSKQPKFPFKPWIVWSRPFQVEHQTKPWTIVHGGQKLEWAQKIHKSRG